MTDSKTAKKIEVVPCPDHQSRYAVTVDGKFEYDLDGTIWCAMLYDRAQAKTAELRNEDELMAKGDVWPDMTERVAAAQPTETRQPRIWTIHQIQNALRAIGKDHRNNDENGQAHCGGCSRDEALLLDAADEIETYLAARAAAPVARPQRFPCLGKKDYKGEFCVLDNGHDGDCEPAARVDQPTPPIACCWCGQGDENHETCRLAVEWERKRVAARVAPVVEQRELPRTETGIVQFENDWPGVFIRGDNAMGLAMNLSGMNGQFFKESAIQELVGLLTSSDARNQSKPQLIIRRTEGEGQLRVHFKGSNTFCCNSDAPCDEMKSVWGKPAQSDAPSAEPMTEFRKALNCLYIAVDAHVADDVVRRANAALEHLTKRAEAAESALSEARERAIQECIAVVQERRTALFTSVHVDSKTGILSDIPRIKYIEDDLISERLRALLAGASGAAGKGGAE